MPNLWDHLPNAKYIDAIIASVREYPRLWTIANPLPEQNGLRERADGWDKTRSLLRASDKEPIWIKIRDYIIQGNTSAWPPIVGLIMYDDCAYMLDADLSEIEILARLGDQRASLMLPACRAFAIIKEKNEENRI